MLDGLRQDPRAWNAKLDSTLGELGFTWCTTEHALYTWQQGKEELIVDVYVDDLIVTGAHAEDIDIFKREMAAHFRMSDLGALSYYLGIEMSGSGLQLTVFSDADMVGDIDGRRSTSGMLIFLRSAPIS